jgi:hypothetical protein
VSLSERAPVAASATTQMRLQTHQVPAAGGASMSADTEQAARLLENFSRMSEARQAKFLRFVEAIRP